MSDTNGRWIKLHTSMLDWEWHDNAEMVSLFVHLLMMAQHCDQVVNGQTIKRGQLVTSLRQLSKSTGISFQSVRTCLARLEATHSITQQSTHRNTLITICKYECYQPKFCAANTPNNTQINTPTYKNIYNKIDDVVVMRARTREQAFTADGMAKWCKALAIDEVTYCTLAEQVFAEWDATDEQDPSVDHFRNTMRIKVEVWRKQQRQLERERNGAETPLERRKRAEREAMAAAAMDINNVINSKKWN